MSFPCGGSSFISVQRSHRTTKTPYTLVFNTVWHFVTKTSRLISSLVEDWEIAQMASKSEGGAKRISGYNELDRWATLFRELFCHHSPLPILIFQGDPWASLFEPLEEYARNWCQLGSSWVLPVCCRLPSHSSVVDVRRVELFGAYPVYLEFIADGGSHRSWHHTFSNMGFWQKWKEIYCTSFQSTFTHGWGKKLGLVVKCSETSLG